MDAEVDAISNEELAMAMAMAMAMDGNKAASFDPIDSLSVA